MRILGTELEIEKNAVVKNQVKNVYKDFLEIVGNGKPTGNVWKETIAVSATIWISVGKVHHQIRLRILSCSRVSENHRGPEVPEAEVRVVECRDGLARITLEQLAITQFVKNGTLQNACSKRPRVVVGLLKSAHTHTVRLMNSRLQGPRKMITKVQWPCWRKMTGMNENLSPTKVTNDQSNSIRTVIRSWDEDHLNIDHLMHDNLVLYSKTWSRRILFSGRAQTCRDQANVWNSQKVISRHTQLRDQSPSLVYICPSELNQRSPNAQKFEDRSQEETEWQEQGAREAAWRLAWSILNIIEKNKAAFFSLAQNWCLRAPKSFL